AEVEFWRTLTVRHLGGTLILFLAWALTAEAREPWIVGQTQWFPRPTVFRYYKAIEVIASDEILVIGVSLETVFYPLLGGKEVAEPLEIETLAPFVLKGICTKDFKSGAHIDVPAFCKVVDAKPVKGVIRFVVVPK